MRFDLTMVSAALALAASLVVVAGVTLAPPLVLAEPGQATAEPAVPVARPDPRTRLDENDRVAALEALQLALTEVGDGSSYVWHARTGRLSGVIRPTQSFKDPAGRICRHIVLLMTAGSYSRTTEGVACRLDSGIWQLEG